MPITHAKRRARLAPGERPQAIANAIESLLDGRQLLRQAGSKKSADAVARAIKSAKGAYNHAKRMAKEHEDDARAARYVSQLRRNRGKPVIIRGFAGTNGEFLCGCICGREPERHQYTEACRQYREAKTNARDLLSRQYPG